MNFITKFKRKRIQVKVHDRVDRVLSSKFTDAVLNTVFKVFCFEPAYEQMRYRLSKSVGNTIYKIDTYIKLRLLK